MPGSGGTQRAARLIGKAHALQLMVESENLDFERALELGLVNYVWQAASREEFQQKVVEYARRFLPPEKASLAIGRIKRAVQSGLEMSFEQALALERELQAELWSSKDAKEGLKAYVDKRKPKFSGK
jgi:enoyl-CoA hydratase/carnithine racemase